MQWQHRERQRGSGSAVEAAASLVAEVEAWRKRNFWRQEERVWMLGDSMVALAETRRWQIIPDVYKNILHIACQ